MDGFKANSHFSSSISQARINTIIQQAENDHDPEQTREVTLTWCEYLRNCFGIGKEKAVFTAMHKLVKAKNELIELFNEVQSHNFNALNVPKIADSLLKAYGAVAELHDLADESFKNNFRSTYSGVKPLIKASINVGEVGNELFSCTFTPSSDGVFKIHFQSDPPRIFTNPSPIGWSHLQR